MDRQVYGIEEPIWHCVELWRSVLVQALLDATQKVRPVKSHANKASRYRARQHNNLIEETREWFLEPDFHDVCGLAALNPETLYAIVNVIRERGWHRDQALAALFNLIGRDAKGRQIGRKN